jgi:hypothetical protein
METLGFDRVYLQEVMVPKWVRGEKKQPISLTIKLRLMCPYVRWEVIATSKNGLTAEVIEVQSLEELAILGKDKIKGKIVFYNRPMDNEQIESFHAYSELWTRDMMAQRKHQSLEL